MNEQYWLVLCVEKDDEQIEKAIEEMRKYMSGGAYGESRGGANYRSVTEYRGMNQREREIYEMGMRDSMTPREREIYEMGKRDAYGRNGAENMRNGGRIPMQPTIPPRGE